MSRACAECGSPVKQTRTYRMQCPECGSIRIIDTVPSEDD